MKTKYRFNPLSIVRDLLDKNHVKWRSYTSLDPQDQINNHPTNLHSTVTLVRVHTLNADVMRLIVTVLANSSDVRANGFKYVGAGFSGKGREGGNAYCLRVTCTRTSEHLNAIPSLCMWANVGSNQVRNVDGQIVRLDAMGTLSHPDYWKPTVAKAPEADEKFDRNTHLGNVLRSISNVLVSNGVTMEELFKYSKEQADMPVLDKARKLWRPLEAAQMIRIDGEYRDLRNVSVPDGNLDNAKAITYGDSAEQFSLSWREFVKYYEGGVVRILKADNVEVKL